MQEITFRASSIGKLMVEPKTKATKEAGGLSETAKTYCEEVWLKSKYGYEEIIDTPAMTKGIMYEQDSLQLVQEVLELPFLAKNRELFKIGDIAGTPDIILPDTIIDVKTSFSLKTYKDCELTNLYKYQGLAYMHLTGVKKFLLAYALVPLSDDDIAKECERIAWKYDRQYDHPEYVKRSMQIKKNNDVILSIPKEERVATFAYSYNEQDMSMLNINVIRAKEYISTLTLLKRK